MGTAKEQQTKEGKSASPRRVGIVLVVRGAVSSLPRLLLLPSTRNAAGECVLEDAQRRRRYRNTSLQRVHSRPECKEDARLHVKAVAVRLQPVLLRHQHPLPVRLGYGDNVIILQQLQNAAGQDAGLPRGWAWSAASGAPSASSRRAGCGPRTARRAAADPSPSLRHSFPADPLPPTPGFIAHRCARNQSHARPKEQRTTRPAASFSSSLRAQLSTIGLRAYLSLFHLPIKALAGCDLGFAER